MTFKKINRIARRKEMKRPKTAAAVAIICGALLYFFSGKPLLSISWDPHEINCLPELRLALLLHFNPEDVKTGDYVFWKPENELSYVKEDYVLKKVAGVPGDLLLIKDGRILVNGIEVATGLQNAILYSKVPKDFERKTIIPANSYFVIGTAQMSNDSRYWGFLVKKSIAGKGYRLL